MQVTRLNNAFSNGMCLDKRSGGIMNNGRGGRGCLISSSRVVE